MRRRSPHLPHAQVTLFASLLFSSSLTPCSNEVAKSLHAVTIAEDVSGYPGMARSVREGGLGFHYRLNMAVADKWIQLLKHTPDEQWSMGDLLHTLINRRHLVSLCSLLSLSLSHLLVQEPHIVYSESHDQSLVGDKTLMMWLAGSQIYTNMSRLQPLSIEIDRAMALHKLILSCTWALGGEGVSTRKHSAFSSLDSYEGTELLRQRVRTSRVGGLSSRGQQRQLSLRAKAVESGQRWGPALRRAESLEQGKARCRKRGLSFARRCWSWRSSTPICGKAENTR